MKPDKTQTEPLIVSSTITWPSSQRSQKVVDLTNHTDTAKLQEMMRSAIRRGATVTLAPATPQDIETMDPYAS